MILDEKYDAHLCNHLGTHWLLLVTGKQWLIESLVVTACGF